MKPSLPKNWGKVNGTDAFNPVKYSDGTLSREVEEDWETTGEEEMSRLHAQCTQKRSILHVRDRLNNIKDLITICHEALTNSELNEIKTMVSNVLYFHVQQQIKLAEEELADV